MASQAAPHGHDPEAQPPNEPSSVGGREVRSPEDTEDFRAPEPELLGIRTDEEHRGVHERGGNGDLKTQDIQGGC